MERTSSHKILSLPNDNIRRMAHIPGAVFFNTLNAAISVVEIPFVELIIVNGIEQLSKNSLIKKIGVSQIGSVRYGAIFEGQSNTGEVWEEGEGYETNSSFDFNFDISPPETIHFGSKNDKGYYFIQRKKCNFDFILKKSQKAHFLQSQLTKLTTEEGISVLIPSIEVLGTIISPFEKSLCNKLMTTHIDTIVTEYLKVFTFEDKRYTIEYHDGGKKKDTSDVLLAYMAMNPQSRSRLSLLRTSMVGGNRESPKFPIILPYQPGRINIVGDVIAMGYKTFLCVKVKSVNVSLPYNVMVNTKQDKKPDKDNSMESIDVPRKKNKATFDINDLGITHQNNPSTGTPRVYITSDVSVGGIDGIVTKNIVNHKDKQDPLTQNSSLTDEDIIIEIEPPDYLSTGDQEATQDALGTAKLEHKENLITNPQERVNHSHLFSMIIESLRYLTQESKNPLESFSYIDDHGKCWDTPKLCNFLYPETKYAISHTKWAYKVHNAKELLFIPRGALLLKLSLRDGREAYLLEIEQKNNSEGFAGMLFNVLEEFKTEEIKSLLVEISSYKGVIRQQKENSLKRIELEHVADSLPYTHYKDKHVNTYISMLNTLIIEDARNIFT